MNTNRAWKFRAWETAANDWLKMHDGEVYYVPVPECLDDSVIIEQWTGLKDKNGKDLYEGDVVEILKSYGYGFLPKGSKAIVGFDEKELCYKLIGQGSFRLTANKEVEIAGNIHENPELLKEEV